MNPEPGRRRVLLTHASPDCFSSVSRSILARLGYGLYTPEEFAASPAAANGDLPDLRIVDERNMAEVPEDGSPSIPIIVLTGRHGVTGADPRIVGALRRPAGLHELYRLTQEVLEETPRATPRVPTHLPAHCRRETAEWRGAVLSLSESGCLLRSTEPQMLGSTMTLSLTLPRSGLLSVDAEVSYQLLPDLGLTFHATSPSDRAAIRSFIEHTLSD
ncbi:MAG: PilZ domain-containing protein [Myxococcota bacterium]